MKTPSLFSVGDRVTLIKSPSLPAEMVGIKAIVTEVDPNSPEDYFKYGAHYRMDGKTPIESGADTIAEEILDASNMRLGWD